VFERDRFTLQEQWSCVSDEMRRLRENPETAAQARLEIRVQSARLVPRVVSRDFLNFKSPSQEVSCGRVKQPQPKVAILREQGTNGYLEMAAAWMAVGFTCVDVHMSDILSGVDDLTGYRGLAVCGGFSYGDVLGAGRGWALRILYQARLNRIFRDFFSRSDTFTLGVCNGCQMLSVLKTLIPGARHWPWFLQNRSRQFEARLSQVVITESPSILLQGLAGSVLPIVVSHGEGRVEWGPSPQGTPIAQTAALGCLRFVDSQGSATERYPANPNGSPGGLTGFTTADGRATIMMPHPERVFRSAQLSWHPREWGEYSPWIQLFANARAWVG
jgi:phosphoribosylformylglycinamidine synthase